MLEKLRLTNIRPTAHRFVSQRLSLNYWCWGADEAEKPLLMLVHGGKDHARSWDWVAERLAPHWRIVAPDLRGHGDSAWSPDGNYTMESIVVDMANFQAHLGAGPVPIVAHSMGGAITLRYAGLFPERVARLVIMEGLATIEEFIPAAKDVEEQRTRWRAWVETQQGLAGRTPRGYADRADAIARMKARNPHLSDEQAAHLAHWAMQQGEDGAWRWKFDPMIQAFPPASASDPVRSAIYGAIDCPVLLVHGKESWASNPEEDGRQALFKDARTVSFAGAGHWMHHDRLDDFVTMLSEFL